MQSLWRQPMQILESLKLFSTIFSFQFVLNPHNSILGCFGNANNAWKDFSIKLFSATKNLKPLYTSTVCMQCFFLYCHSVILAFSQPFLDVPTDQMTKCRFVGLRCQRPFPNRTLILSLYTVNAGGQQNSQVTRRLLYWVLQHITSKMWSKHKK